MLCPVCRHEYDDSVKTCPECDVSLVDKLNTDSSEPADSQYVELVTIMETSDRALIAFVKSILDDAGIKYFINGETLLDLGRAIIDVKIQVGKNDAKTAVELLNEVM